MRYFLTILSLYYFTTFSYSQLQINATLNLFNFDEFNQELARNQYPIFSNEAYTFEALSTSYDDDDSKVGTRNGFLYTLFQTEGGPTNLGTPNTNRNVEMRSIGFLSGFEFGIVKNRFLSIAPSLDFIFSQQRLIFISDFPGTNTFGNLLSSDPQIETYRNVRLMIDGRLNILLHFGKKDGVPRFGIGVTGGYRLDPFTPTWKYERLEKVDIPGTQQNGVHFGALLTVKLSKFTPPGTNKKEQKS